MLPAIILFAATYILMLIFSKYRPYIALASGVIFIVSGMLPLGGVIDAGKAVLACVLGGLLLQPYGLGLEGRVLGGACVMLGHVFPALQGFRGGKGILSGLFVALSVDWRIAMMIVVVFFTFYLLTQYVSLGSILSSLAFGIGFVVFHHNNLPVMLGGLFMSALAIFMHRGNLVRLLKGQERKTNLLSKGKKE